MTRRFSENETGTADRGTSTEPVRNQPRLAQADVPSRHGVLSEELRHSIGQSSGSTTEALKALMTIGGLRTRISEAARKWNVHPLATVGAIAWEATLNPRLVSVFAAGVAKVHFREYLPPFGEGEPLARQLEEMGYLAVRSMEARREALLDPKIAVEYIGAAFHAFSVLAEKHGYAIRENLGVLGFAYNAKKLDTWDRHLQDKAPAPLRAGEMGLWIESNLTYLREIYPDRSKKVSDAAAIGFTAHITPTAMRVEKIPMFIWRSMSLWRWLAKFCDNRPV